MLRRDCSDYLGSVRSRADGWRRIGCPSGGRSARPASVEAIPGSDLKRVILTAEAANRIALETMAVREEPVKRWLLVDGQVEAIHRSPPLWVRQTLPRRRP